MKILQPFETQIGLRSSVSKSTTVFILTLFIFFNTANFSLANQGGTSQLMRHAANLSQNGKNEEALKIFLEITRKEPNNFYAYNNLGMVYSLMEEKDKALNAYEKSLSINPAFPMTLNNIGYLHMTMNHYDKAEMFLKKALSLFGSFHLVSTNLGELYLKQKRYSEAMTYLKKSLKDMPDFSPTHRLLGELHQAEGRMDEAEKEFSLFKELRLKSN
jgi:tetratricopeptide (TPR) repeat protein